MTISHWLESSPSPSSSPPSSSSLPLPSSRKNDQKLRHSFVENHLPELDIKYDGPIRKHVHISFIVPYFSLQYILIDTKGCPTLTKYQALLPQLPFNTISKVISCSVGILVFSSSKNRCKRRQIMSYSLLNKATSAAALLRISAVKGGSTMLHLLLEIACTCKH